MIKTGIITGCFDIIHPGYIKMFAEAKVIVDEIIVLLHDDPSIERPFKLKPILSLQERIEILSSIKYIDKIVVYNFEKELAQHILNINPDVRFLGDDYRERTDYTGYDPNQYVHYFDRSHGWSSTLFKKKISASLNHNILSEPKLFDLKKFTDNRGSFSEVFNDKISKEINAVFVQDNESHSVKNVIRGMHYQWDNPMGKLVRCVTGKINDYVVDIRKNSDTYGEYRKFPLSEDESKCLWVPAGFAHGFETLSEKAIVSYKCSALYNKNGESGINPFDKDLALPWEIKQYIVSEKDLCAKSFSEYNKDSKF